MVQFRPIQFGDTLFSPNANTFASGGPFADLGPVDYTGSGPETTLYRLAYTFKPLEDLTLTFGLVIFPSDCIDANVDVHCRSL